MDPGAPPTPYSPYAPPTTPAPGVPHVPEGFERPPDDPDAAFGRRRESFFKRRIAPIGAALVALLAKLKALLLLLPKIKLLTTAGSMLVSIAAYAMIWGFQFAAGFVVLILVHELGHVIALRREGIKASAPLFIPFMGAVIGARSLGDNALAEARVGLAGPILGSIGAGLCLVVWALTGHDFWRALGYTGLFLNLFNLLPVVPLDGGRAMAAMTPWMWYVGFFGICVLALTYPSPIILIIAVIAAFETYRRIKQRRTHSPQQEAYYRVSPRNRLLVGATYIGLVVALAIGLNLSHLPRTLG
jgi:Zn-dependent protease